MEDSEAKVRNQLAVAAKQFLNREYAGCRKTLTDTKLAHPSLPLNSLLCDYKQYPRKAPLLAQKLLAALPPSPPPALLPPGAARKSSPLSVRTQLEFYFWNVVVLSQLYGNTQLAEQIAHQATRHIGTLRTETSLMLLYTLLKAAEQSARLASALVLVEQVHRVVPRGRQLLPEEQGYRFLNQILFNRVLLKLGLVENSKVMFMMRFNQGPEEGEEDITQIQGVPVRFYQELLHAEIEFHEDNNQQALAILGELMAQTETLPKSKELLKAVLHHNVAVVLSNWNQAAAAQLLFRKALLFFSSPETEGSTQRASMILKCKENMLLSSLSGRNPNYALIFAGLNDLGKSVSFKINYRKAELCMNFYHHLLKTPDRVLPYQQIHDFYETVYFYPNQPYFQQKSKNKNPNYTNGKFSYRRYVLHNSEQSVKEPVDNRGKDEGKDSKREASKDKKKVVGKQKTKREDEPQPKEEVKAEHKEGEQTTREVLQLAQFFLKEALQMLEKERTIIVNVQCEEKGLTEQANAKLHAEQGLYRSNIYTQLCYVYLCKQEWSKSLHYACEYEQLEKKFKFGPSPSHFNILNYKMEALYQLHRLANCYETVHEMLGDIDYSDQKLSVRSTNQQPGSVYFEAMSQFDTFCFNLAVLHSRDNKIPESFQSIQKLLQQLRLSPTNPQAHLPLSLIELLLHYNLRTSNTSSALQLLKRRRILNIPVPLTHFQPTLTVTK